MTDKLYFKYWGKADRNAEAGNPQCHLLPYHCLDVAAVGKVLLNRNKALLDFFVENSGLDEKTFIATTLYFLSMHDAGRPVVLFERTKKE